jgi:hypothetical protein
MAAMAVQSSSVGARGRRWFWSATGLMMSAFDAARQQGDLFFHSFSMVERT